MKVRPYLMLFILVIANIMFFHRISIADDGNVIEMETVSIIPYYNDYPREKRGIIYYYDNRSGENCDLDNSTNYWIGYCFNVFPHPGLGTYIDPTAGNYEPFLQPSPVLPMKTYIDFYRIDDNKKIRLAETNLAPVSPLGTVGEPTTAYEEGSCDNVSFSIPEDRLEDVPDELYRYFGEGFYPGQHAFQIKRELIEMYTGKKKTATFFEFPYTVGYTKRGDYYIPCSKGDCVNSVCNPGKFDIGDSTVNLIGPTPDYVEAYRDKTGEYSALTTAKWEYKRPEQSLLEQINSMVNDELINFIKCSEDTDNCSKSAGEDYIECTKDCIGTDNQSEYDSCAQACSNQRDIQEENCVSSLSSCSDSMFYTVLSIPNTIADMLFGLLGGGGGGGGGGSGGFLGGLTQTISDLIDTATSDFIIDPIMFVVKFLFVEVYHTWLNTPDVDVAYVKLDFQPVDNAPKLNMIYYGDDGKPFLELKKSGSLLEFQNKQPLIDDQVADIVIPVDYSKFKNYHNKDFKYDVKMTFYYRSINEVMMVVDPAANPPVTVPVRFTGLTPGPEPTIRLVVHLYN